MSQSERFEIEKTAGPSTQAGGALRFEGVAKRYGEFMAVNSFNLSIAPGEFLTLLGPSGSGKTTLLSMVAGFQSVTEGAIYLDEKRLDTLPPEKRDIGMVVQNYALFPHMSVYRNIAFPLRMRKVRQDKIEERVKTALELVELSDQRDKFPGQLSGGQQQRVALARAVVFQPQLLLMDEPLGALDRRLREAVQFELIEMHRKLSTTVVYVTHDQVEALTMSDRIVVLKDGVVQQIGSPKEIYQTPSNKFVATFIGNSIALDGVVTKVDGRTCQLKIDNELEFQGVLTNEIRQGDPATLMVRPERIEMTADLHANNLKALIVKRIFMGELTRYTVQLPAGKQLEIDQPNTRGRPELENGSQVSLVWDREDAVIIA